MTRIPDRREPDESLCNCHVRSGRRAHAGECALVAARIKHTVAEGVIPPEADACETPRDPPYAPAPSQRDSATRKGQPIATGVLAYFPKAMAAVAEQSRRGNDKHCPGEPLHWAREKSTDEADACVRHITDALSDPGGPLALDADGAPHLVGAAWRVLAWLERALEGDERWRGVARPSAAETKVSLGAALICAECGEVSGLYHECPPKA